MLLFVLVCTIDVLQAVRGPRQSSLTQSSMFFFTLMFSDLNTGAVLYSAHFEDRNQREAYVLGTLVTQHKGQVIAELFLFFLNGGGGVEVEKLDK